MNERASRRRAVVTLLAAGLLALGALAVAFAAIRRWHAECAAHLARRDRLMAEVIGFRNESRFSGTTLEEDEAALEQAVTEFRRAEAQAPPLFDLWQRLR